MLSLGTGYFENKETHEKMMNALGKKNYIRINP